MAFSAAALSHASFSCLSSFPQTLRRRNHLRFSSIRLIKAAAAEPEKEKATTTTQTKNAEGSSNAQPQTPAAQPRPKKPVYSMKKGQIVRVDKEKYLNSVNYLSVGHPPYYKGLDYIYEDRGEVLDLRNFETGEYALVAWVGIPTAPAWLPTDMLIKSEKLDYERL
ncbi:NAD(P)H:plastoquinone dehydrogenase complex subunit O isoform 1 [Theobroma cacao]|uniref:NAD(P)H:plastoquinone dehydrogenase complex subunit O isoform 1 n=1 Tax=Theobroma cacao TaxID=3641 RepID=A0A061DJL2_THECC|nr:NAD(P)H:plastoquinone dehydrogenase complex subunit O isoform 1 [Theobroma cacao]